MLGLGAPRLAHQVAVIEGLATLELTVAAQAVEVRHGTAPPLGVPLSRVFDAVRGVVAGSSAPPARAGHRRRCPAHPARPSHLTGRRVVV
jgi:hypothetical protein